MFIDASAIVAIILREPAAARLVAGLPSAGTGITSAIAVYEAALAIAREGKVSPQTGLADVLEFLAKAEIAIEPIDAADAAGAVAAFARYGKGRHPAGLNLGDCFAYAQASARDLPLLYVGNDFAQTDIPPALPGA